MHNNVNKSILKLINLISVLFIFKFFLTIHISHLSSYPEVIFLVEYPKIIYTIFGQTNSCNC